MHFVTLSFIGSFFGYHILKEGWEARKGTVKNWDGPLNAFIFCIIKFAKSGNRGCQQVLHKNNGPLSLRRTDDSMGTIFHWDQCLKPMFTKGVDKLLNKFQPTYMLRYETILCVSGI